MRVNLDLQDHEDLVDLQGLLVLLVPQAQLEPQAHKDHQAKES
jgi:hypothetical protein